MGDMIGGLAYDQLYAEHMYIWSITSLNNAFRPYGMEIFDAEHNDFHGGCMRYYLCKKSAHGKTRRLLDAIAKETALGLGDSDTYNRFRDACEDSRLRLRSQISRLRSEGKRIVGYGATAKSATIINFCGLTVDDIEFISDTTPAKQHKFTPGAHIPVKPHEEFVRDYPDYAVLFAWNHFSEINAKEPEFREHGGKWIIPIGPIDIL